MFGLFCLSYFLGLNFDKKHSYSNDDLLITKMRFVIEHINPLFFKTEENGE